MQSLFCHWRGIGVKAFSFLGSGFTPYLDMISWKMRFMNTLNDTNPFLVVDLLLWIFVLLSSICCYDPCYHHHNLPLIYHQQFQIHFTIPWIFCLIFLRNMSPAVNGSCLYLFLPNWWTNIMRHHDCSSSLRLWYPEFATIRDKYLTLFSFRIYYWG